jgi:hypothetical protein
MRSGVTYEEYSMDAFICTAAVTAHSENVYSYIRIAYLSMCYLYKSKLKTQKYNFTYYLCDILSRILGEEQEPG